MVFESNPVDLCGWEAKEKARQFARQWNLRMMPQEGALKELTNSRLRRPLAVNKSLTCTDVKVGDTVVLYKAQRKKSPQRWRSPALILDIDEMGATVKFQPQPFKVSRFRMRKKGADKDVEDSEIDPLQARFRPIGADLGSQLRQVDLGKEMEGDREDGESTQSTGTPESGSGPRPGMIPAPDLASLSAQLPPPRTTLERRQLLESFFDKTCAPSQAPRAEGAQYGEITREQLHEQCPQCGKRKRESKELLKTRLSTMGAAEEKRSTKEVAKKDGKRERAPVTGVKVADNPTQPTD